MAQRISKIVLTDGGVWDSSKTYPPYTYVRHNGDGWWSTRSTTASEPAKSNADWVQATDTQEFIVKLKEATSEAQAITDSATQAEQLRVEAEQARVDAENKRNADETLRELAEAERLAEESKRQNAEKNRVAAEAVRDGRYNEAEENRNTVFLAAESERQAAEEARKQAEAARIQAENERDAAEQVREALTVETKAAAADAKSATEAANTAAGKANEAADKFNAAIVQETGEAQDKVISQYGVTEAINGVTNKVTELSAEVGDLLRTDYTKESLSIIQGVPDRIINEKGELKNRAGMSISAPIFIPAGKIVCLYCDSYTSSAPNRIVAISKTDANATYYEPVTFMREGKPEWRTYICGEDTYVAFCYYTSFVETSAYTIDSQVLGDIGQLLNQTRINNADMSEKIIKLANLLAFDFNVTEITLTEAVARSYIRFSDGQVVSEPSGAFHVSNPIQLNKGDIISFTSDGAPYAAAISYTDENSSYYKPIIPYYINGKRKYAWIAPSDCFVAITWYSEFENFVIKKQESYFFRTLMNYIDVSDNLIKNYINEKVGELYPTTIREDVGSVLDTNNIDTSTTPATPSINSSWDWQNAYLEVNGRLHYHTSEPQSRLIAVTPGMYRYTGAFSGAACIGFYDVNGKYRYGINAKSITGEQSKDVTDYVFAVTANDAYISVNCKKSHWGKFSLVKLEGDYLNGKAYANTLISSGNNSNNDIRLKPSDVKNFSFDLTYRLTANIANSNGSLDIVTFKTLGHNYRIQYDYATPSSDLILPQKENTANESDIYYPDFPMAQMTTALRLLRDDVEVGKVTLNGYPFKAVHTQVPCMTIRYIPADGEDLSTKTGLRLYVTASNGVCDSLQIKNGDSVIYSYALSAEKDMYFVWKDLKEGLSSIDGYNFELEYSDIEGISVKDLIITKSSGLPFVTKFSSDCKIGGTMVYDNYPVFIEAMDNTPKNLQIRSVAGKVCVYLDNAFLFEYSIEDCEYIDVVRKGKELISFNIEQNHTYDCTPIVKAFTAHSFYNSPSHPADYTDSSAPSLHNAIGSFVWLKKQMDNMGFVNVSADEVAFHILNNRPLPEKSYFIEVDDFASLEGFQKLLSDSDNDGMRMMEMLKRTGIKMGFAQEFNKEDSLFKKIENGTATEVEKEMLSARFSNEQIMKMRAMMNSYGWTVSIHTFIGNPNPTTARFDALVEGIRNTIKWYERMYGRSPISYVTSGTGNSSPYYRRLMPMYGLPIMTQDKPLYSTGSNALSFNARGYCGYREMWNVSKDKDL